LISYGIFNLFEEFSKNPENLNLSITEQILHFSLSCGERNIKDVENVIKSGKMELFLSPELISKISKGIKINKNAIIKEIFKDPNTSLQYYNRISAGGLLILAWENTKGDHTDDPLWEFLRHCRNASAHKGHFHFLHGEPKKPAKWKSLEITHDLHDHPLFSEPPEEGFLGVGDVLYLLTDIEKEYY
jgi:hypothetical protein